jgi:hypothetical protein
MCSNCKELWTILCEEAIQLTCDTPVVLMCHLTPKVVHERAHKIHTSKKNLLHSILRN